VILLVPYILLLMIEQRKLKRFNLRIPATIEVVAQGNDSGKKILYVITKNICAGGAFFDTMNPVPNGTQVKIRLVLNLGRLRGLKPWRAHVKLSGTVLRSEPTRMAIHFDKSYRIIPLNRS
jgi:hypothetical protein